MENVLFSQKRAQDVYKKGGLEILLVSYPILAGEAPLVKHCTALVEALREYAKGEPQQIAYKALAEAIEHKRLSSFSRHHLKINLETVSKNNGIFCTLTLTLFHGKQILFVRTLTLLWDQGGLLQKKCRVTTTKPRFKAKRQP